MSMILDETQIKKLENFLVDNPVYQNNPAQGDADIAQIMDALQVLMRLCGDDPTRDGLTETPYRVVKKFLEYSQGYHEDPKKHLEKTFAVEHNDLVIVKDIEFDSVCEHHFAPIYGKVHVGYIPNDKVTGLSKIGRLVEGYATRFQVQERLTDQIANAMDEVLKPKGVIVIVEAKHMCMCGRGIKKKDSSTTTVAHRGLYENDFARRQEFRDLIKD